MGSKDGDWVIQVKTGEKPAMASNDAVDLFIYGDAGRKGPLNLAKINAGKFKANAIDQFIHRFPLSEVGKVYKIRIGRLEQVEDSWFIDWVKVNHNFTQLALNFECKRWLSRKMDDQDVWREMPAVYKDEKPLALLRYKLLVYTGRRLGSETDARISVELRGQRGDSGPRVLFKPLNGNPKTFRQNQMDEFEIEAVDLDDLTSLFVFHGNKEKGTGWFLERITVRVDSLDKEWHFACKKWLDTGEEDGVIERILYPGAPPPKGKTFVEQKFVEPVVNFSFGKFRT